MKIKRRVLAGIENNYPHRNTRKDAEREVIFSCFSVCSVDNFQSLCRILAILIATALSAWALDPSERTFIWNEANAMMASAVTPADYLHAMQTYQKLVDGGVRNGPLFYNLGTALLQAGRYDHALDALLRAERYLGRQPDILRNMKIAMARKSKTDGAQRATESVEWPWYRILLFWHFALSGSARAGVAVSAFTLFWLALTLRLLGLKRGVNAMAVLALLAFVAFGSSMATTWHQELTAKRYLLDVPSVPLMK